MGTGKCPNCKKFTFNVSLLTFLGKCHNCGLQKKIDEDTWKLEYDYGYDVLRAILKFNESMREHLVDFFDLDKSYSSHLKYLLTNDVVETLKKEAPEIYRRLPDSKT